MASIAPPFETLEQYRALAGDLGKLVETTFRRRTVKTRQRILRVVRTKPGAVVYADNGHLRWKSRKQQKAFFASGGFGGGVPHERTDAYTDAFDVVIDTTDYAGTVSVVNDYPGAIYIGGDEQQPFHVDTGWLNITAAMENERPRVESDYENDFDLLANPEALTQ